MTASTVSTHEDESSVPAVDRGSLWRKLSFRNMSAVYLTLALILLFSLLVPKSFLRPAMWGALLDTTSVTIIVSLGLLIPVCAGAFDLSVGAVVGFGAILVAWVVSSTEWPLLLVVVVSLVSCALIGLTSGLLVTRWRIDPFITTLGMSSIAIALTSWVSGDQQILGLRSSFQALADTQVLGVTTTVWAALVLAIVLWYITEQTEWGRRLIATGANTEASRLAGIPVKRVILQALTVGAMIAGFAGIMSSAKLGTGDPSIGPPFLLPAATAVFLGSTQFRNGRFNVWGTVMATLLLAIGVKGFQLMGAPVWLPDLFNGVALLLAVGLTQISANRRRPRTDKAPA